VNHLRILRTLAPVLALTACHAPTVVAEKFHEAMAKGDGSKAYELLAAKTQAELTAVAKKASEASGGTLSPDPTLMIVAGDLGIYPARKEGQPNKPVKATLLSQESKRAKVSVRIGEGQHELDLVQEQLRWRVDLPIVVLRPDRPSAP